MASFDNQAPVNLVRSLFLCNVFHFFLSASKACLFPFLTIYLKQLGLSATQTGVIVGAKTITGLVFAPLWSKCSVRCGRRRCMLMFSLFFMAVTYLSLTAVPSINEDAFASRCAITHNNFNVSQLTDVNTFHKGTVTGSVTPALNDSNIGISPAQKTNVMSTSLVTSNSANAKPSIEDRLRNALIGILVDVGMPLAELKELSDIQLRQLIDELTSSKDGLRLLSETLQKHPDSAFALELKHRKRAASDEETEHEKDSDESSWKQNFMKVMTDFRNHIRDTENDIFIVVLVVLMVGESLSCPIGKIADDGWFEFLEGIDDMEKYGMHRIWSSFAYILLPLTVTLAVDNTNCLFGRSIHPFMLHFFLFGVFCFITFILAIFYPMATSEKYKYANKVMKGMQIVCCNMRSIVFVITLMVMGTIYASYYNYLFWVLLDMGSTEITLGLCLTLAALAEIPMLLFNDKLVNKIGNGGIVSLSLLFLSARCLYYSFLPSPWAVIPAEITHAVTHTAMWWAILSSPSFNSSPGLNRSIRSILSSIYFGLGFAFGSIISGFAYDFYGRAILFQSGSVLAIGWFPFLCLGVRCFKDSDKNKVKYTRLLTSDDASDDKEDDWLEEALNDK